MSGLIIALYLDQLLSPIDVHLKICDTRKASCGGNLGPSQIGSPSSASATVGGPLGIALTGVHVLQDLDENVFNFFVAQGPSMSTILGNLQFSLDARSLSGSRPWQPTNPYSTRQPATILENPAKAWAGRCRYPRSIAEVQCGGALSALDSYSQMRHQTSKLIQ